MRRTHGPRREATRRHGRPLPLLLAAPLIALPILATACGSGAVAGTASGGGLAKAPQALCHKLTNVLANGPDADVDPVGYALSQIIPLQAIHSSDTAAVNTLANLVTADRALVKSNGTDRAAKTTIKKDDARLNAACPGVIS